MQVCLQSAFEQDVDTKFEIPLSKGSFEAYEMEGPAQTLEVTKREIEDLYLNVWRIR